MFRVIVLTTKQTNSDIKDVINKSMPNVKYAGSTVLPENFIGNLQLNIHRESVAEDIQLTIKLKDKLEK